MVVFSLAFLIQCSDDAYLEDEGSLTTKAGKGGNGGGHEEPAAGNNLSFPVFALDGITLTPISAPTFLVPYAGPYTGLTTEEITLLQATGPWYAQKVEGNLWQAEFMNGNAPLAITFIDWGDVIEAVNPKTGRPFRVEVTLYSDISDATMTGYGMVMLANPSSPDEVQGTKGDNTYDGVWATVASDVPNLIIQQLAPGASLTWDAELLRWVGVGVGMPVTGFGFAPELNVGGKYIYGASTGGWRPTQAGTYRLTFYLKGNSNINMRGAVIGNYDGNVPDQWAVPETRASIPVVDPILNLTYADVIVVRK
jgi:hypothetical protein